MTTRSGGLSRGAFASLNLGRGCGDRLADVRANRARVAAELGASS
ncbi:MAG: laccase domain-containing protein, partial [Planctomycetota bacterium]|nr:laccase domain-containing protein [Planctomycetota bacterium]